MSSRRVQGLGGSVSKRGMRAAGVCLATVAVMSGSVSANVSAALSDSSQRLAAEDFTVTFSATPTRVVLSPDGGKTEAKYRIVVRHPKSIDQVDSVRLRFKLGGQHLSSRFSMGGSVIRQPSVTRTVLAGRSGFTYRQRWARDSAAPGVYTPQKVTLWVTKDGESSSLEITPPTGRIRVYYAPEVMLQKPSRTGSDGRLRLEGSLRCCSWGYDRLWESAAGQRVKVMFLRHGSKEPRKVTSTKTDDGGDFTVDVRAHRPGRWWVRFPGNRHLEASRSVGYEVSASS